MTKRNEDQGVPPIIHDDDQEGSIEKDTHHEHTRRIGVRKYLKKSYCYRINALQLTF